MASFAANKLVIPALLSCIMAREVAVDEGAADALDAVRLALPRAAAAMVVAAAALSASVVTGLAFSEGLDAARLALPRAAAAMVVAAAALSASVVVVVGATVVAGAAVGAAVFGFLEEERRNTLVAFFATRVNTPIGSELPRDS